MASDLRRILSTGRTRHLLVSEAVTDELLPAEILRTACGVGRRHDSVVAEAPEAYVSCPRCRRILQAQNRERRR